MFLRLPRMHRAAFRHEIQKLTLAVSRDYELLPSLGRPAQIEPPMH